MARVSDRAKVRLAHASAVLTPTFVPSEQLVAKQSTVFPILPADSRPLTDAEATTAALALGNRGPLVLDNDGHPLQYIVDAFEHFGFYVFEGLIQPPELAELQQDIHAVLDSATAAKRNGEETFEHFGVQVSTAAFGFTRPLSDNSGPSGRSPTAMTEYAPPPGAPEEICRGGSYYLRFSRPGVRLYGHPKLLAMAEAVNGPRFTPFSDSIQYKEQGLGPAVAWHQDGTTNWEAHGSAAEHGFNFMAQLHGSTAENGVWVVAGSHRWGHIDIPQLVATWGERLPGALPMIAAAGDVVMCNRNGLHCSFPNRSSDTRITLNFGFHKRSAVEAKFAVSDGSAGTVRTQHLSPAEIDERCRAIKVAVAARRQRHPDETPHYQYDEQGEEQWKGLDEAEQHLMANCYIGL